MQSIHLLRVAGKQMLIQLFLFHLCSYKTDRVNALMIWLTCLSCCEKSAPLRSSTLLYAPNRGIKLQQLAELRFNVQYFYHFVDWTEEFDEIKSKYHQHFIKTIWNNQFRTLPPRILRCFEQKVCVCKSGQTKLTRSYFWETNANFEFGMHCEKLFFSLNRIAHHQKYFASGGTSWFTGWLVNQRAKQCRWIEFPRNFVNQ